MRKELPLLYLLFMLVSVCCYGQNDGRSQYNYAPAPSVAIKTNLLYGAAATPNIGVEFRLGNKTTLDIPVNWNPFTFADNRKWKHLLVQPELRKWICEPFNGHFFGLHAHYAMYNVGNINVGNLKLPAEINLSELSNHRYDGWLAGAGLTYGYQLYLGPRFNAEFAIGAGYAYIDYKKYECRKCGEQVEEGNKHYFGPTKATIALVYLIK